MSSLRSYPGRIPKTTPVKNCSFCLTAWVCCWCWFIVFLVHVVFSQSPPGYTLWKMINLWIFTVMVAPYRECKPHEYSPPASSCSVCWQLLANIKQHGSYNWIAISFMHTWSRFPGWSFLNPHAAGIILLWTTYLFSVSFCSLWLKSMERCNKMW